MWPFTKKYSILQSGILKGSTDWHSHILPGVDDGIRTLEESLQVLSFYGQTGIKEVWLTPHIMEDCPNETAALKAGFLQLKAAYHGPIVLHLAAENMLDALFESRLSAGDLLPIGSGEGRDSGLAPKDGHEAGHAAAKAGQSPMVLVETSYFNPPIAFEQTLEKMRQGGLQPLLAHPERYVYMEERDYVRLKEDGVRFQLNLMSLAGMYGEHAARKASRLLEGGFYDLAGSDLHRLSHWQAAIDRKVLTGKQVDDLYGLTVRSYSSTS